MYKPDLGGFPLRSCSVTPSKTPPSARDAELRILRPRLPFLSPVSKMAAALPPRPRPSPARPSPQQARPASPPRDRAARSRRLSPRELHPGRRQRGRRRLFPAIVQSGGWGPARAACTSPAALRCRSRSRRSLRRGEAGRPAPRGSPCVGGRGREAAEPAKRSSGSGRRAAPAPARLRDALWGGLAQPPAGDRAGLLR